MNLSAKLNPFGHVAVLLFALSALAFPSVAQTDGFDAPLKKNVVDVGPAPYYPAGSRVRAKLSCYFFPTFVVKEYDTGQKGAELEIVTTEKGATPACTLTHAPEERVIEVDWGGGFKGAKGNLVFFYAPDGTNGGMPFAIYDARTGAKVFQDVAFDSTYMNNKVEVSLFNRPRVRSAPDGQVSLRYRRVVEADCDLHREKASCWEQVRKKLELKSAQMPVRSSYRGIPTRWPSAVAYPVEVPLFPQPTIKTIVGPVKCWPVD